ncbi:hypothetical protein MSAN_01886800 [Mycena sanguinolenta]|uniref:Uncharacterized protein n=1 Tax=Mycena sanguinolenta TaxID=230812 RepID=A0A8H7CSK8_9AGAR|nr:hypothetical protein MSAN_01886800 [Mycena sanguinolenta]
MFSLAYLSVLGVVALGPQVVLGSFKFTLSPVVQCEPVNITFSGSGANNHSVPTTFTIFPLQDNAEPIEIPIPNGATNSTGIQLTFIPLPADTLFIASLDNINGPKPTVSDVTRVQNSTTGGCFQTNPSPVTFYQPDEELSQCEDFTVTYNTSVAPNITAFVPLVGAFPVFPSNVSTISSTLETTVASYTADIVREVSVMLLLDDQQGHRQTTKLITVSGDSSSPKTCFNTTSSKDSTPKASATPVSKLPQSAIIGISVGAAVVGLLAIFLLIYMLLARRRNRRVSHMDFDPALLNQKWPPDLEEKKIESYQASPLTAPSFSTPPFTAQGFVRDPIYTREKYASSIVSDGRSSISSWNEFAPKHRGVRSQSISSSRLSMGTVEIQDILQIATVHRTPSASTTNLQGRPTPQPSTAGTAMTFDIAKPAIARLVSTRRSRRASDTPSVPDVPVTVSRNNSTDAATALAGVPTKYRTSYASFDDDDVDEGEVPRPDDRDIGGYPIPSFKTGVLRNRDTSESWGNVMVR